MNLVLVFDRKSSKVRTQARIMLITIMNAMNALDAIKSITKEMNEMLSIVVFTQHCIYYDINKCF